jgi:hypothetical protein
LASAIASQARGTVALTFVSVILLISSLTLNPSSSSAQDTIPRITDPTHIGGYGEMVYYDPNGTTPGQLDLSRIVIFLSHQFSDRWSFKSELETEHVKVEVSDPGGEFEIEQAFLDFHVSDALNFRGGLYLIPSGIINQTHEPTTFFSVGRPHVDEEVIPTTWREIGAGLFGDLGEYFKYQAYFGEGLSAAGYDETGIYEGRQEGKQSNPTNPSISAKIDYLPTPGLRFGASIYYQTNTASALQTQTDSGASTPVAFTSPLSVIAFDGQYDHGALHVRGEYAMDAIGNALQLSATLSRAIPSKVTGGYLDVGYNVIPLFCSSSDVEVIPFVRYEMLQHNFDATQGGNQSRNYVIAGVACRPTDGVIIKANYEFCSQSQFAVNENEFMTKGLLSIGLGYAF